MSERYLGDGLYASFDGWQIRLRAPRPDGDHVIYLEPGTYVALAQFAANAAAGLVELEPQRPVVIVPFDLDTPS